MSILKRGYGRVNKSKQYKYTVELVLALASHTRYSYTIWSRRRPLTGTTMKQTTALLVVHSSMKVATLTSLYSCGRSPQHGETPARTVKLWPAGSWAEAARVCCLHGLCGKYSYTENVWRHQTTCVRVGDVCDFVHTDTVCRERGGSVDHGGACAQDGLCFFSCMLGWLCDIFCWFVYLLSCYSYASTGAAVNATMFQVACLSENIHLL